ncbi:hypothetical protein TNCV_988001 [Trichonephila clavipes]|nr:hypothetical protein TNCV_988001 [Trichonephila clavipes]
MGGLEHVVFWQRSFFLSGTRPVALMRKKCGLRHYNGDSMGTWRYLGKRAKLASFLTTKLATAISLVAWRPFLVSLLPYGFFWKLEENLIILRSMTQADFSRRILEAYK